MRAAATGAGAGLSRAAGAATDTGGGARLPWRGPGPSRPDLPLPPGAMPLRRNGAWLKSWRYVAAFADEAFVVGARVRVGPIGQTFWAVVDRSSGRLHERTRTRLPLTRGEVWTEQDGARVEGPVPAGSTPVTRIESRGVSGSMQVGEGAWAESVCPTPEGNYVWTRKRVGAPIEIDISFPGGQVRTTARGVEDESAGYHPNPTEWFWSAGAGTAADGRAVGWNLVSGVNDPERGSERAIWIDGEPYEPGPVEFDPGLASIRFAGGSRLAFDAEAERRSKKNMLLVAYDYRQPFGTFTGTLDGIELAAAAGVMEYHLARW